jgi:hypothetical protein
MRRMRGDIADTGIFLLLFGVSPAPFLRFGNFRMRACGWQVDSMSVTFSNGVPARPIPLESCAARAHLGANKEE